MTVRKQDVRKSQFLESANLVYEEGNLARPNSNRRCGQIKVF